MSEEYSGEEYSERQGVEQKFKPKFLRYKKTPDTSGAFT